MAARLEAGRGWAHAGKAAGAVVAALWLGLAGALHARNAVWESALALWTDATAGGRGTSRSFVGLGSALLARGEPDRGLAAFQAALDRARGQPLDEAQALHHIGVALLAQGRAGEAEAALRGAAERAPELAGTAYALAHLLWRKGDLVGAEDYARRSLAVQGDRGDATHLLGKLRLEGGRIEEATALLEKAAQLAPRVAAVHVDLGLAYRRAGRVAEACDAWRTALRLPALGVGRARVAELMASAGCRSW